MRSRKFNGFPNLINQRAFDWASFLRAFTNAVFKEKFKGEQKCLM